MYRSILLLILSVLANDFGLAPFYHTVELIWLQDFSYSADVDTVSDHFNDVMDELKWIFPHAKFGLGGFVDKPMRPFGYEVSNDYCYHLRQNLTRSTEALTDSFKRAKVHSGGDWKEAQLHAMLEAALSDETGWHEDDVTSNGYQIQRFIVVATDAGFHQAGDSSLPANDGDSNTDCLGEDYPSIEQVTLALKQRQIFPIFVVNREVSHLYRDLLHSLHDYGLSDFATSLYPAGLVWELNTEDPEDLKHGISTAINMKIQNDCGHQRCDGGGCLGDDCPDVYVYPLSSTSTTPSLIALE